MPSNLSTVTTPSQWCDWLRRFGPLWVSIEGNPAHAVIVCGMVGDRVHVRNPWNTMIGFDPSDPVDFNPVNEGRSYSERFDDLIGEFGRMSLNNYGRWRIMYLP